MLYYGDRVRTVAPREELAALRARLASAPRSSTDEHARLCALLVSAGELAQGLADALFDACGADDDGPLRDASMAFAAAAARAVWGSWTGTLDAAARAAPAAALGRLEATDLPARVGVRLPEGFLHYAVYPECHGEAARRLSAPPRLVVGIRSIGTSLAAMASAATGAAAFTVRPTGHPFQRRIALRGELAERVVAACRAGARVAVADEGPGLSGSSFLAVARWLEDAGARRDHVAFLPSHDGPPGAAASDEARARWSLHERRAAAFEELVLPRVARWAGQLAGDGAILEDVSAGAWRRRAVRSEERWPPVFRQQERRKYLARGRRRAVLLRFAGVGGHGEESLARARRLAEADLAPPVLALAHGFLAHPWLDGRLLVEAAIDREALVRHLATYLAFRARALPAARGDGASPEALLTMLRANAAAALGEAAGEAAGRFRDALEEVARLPRVEVDGKLERWEWLVTATGHLLKLDAVDHARGHDLAGCQPVAWDLAGAAIELGLTDAEARDLRARVARETGVEVAPRAQSFLEAAYLALRVGRWTFARDAEGDAPERARIERILAGYQDALRRCVFA